MPLQLLLLMTSGCTQEQKRDHTLVLLMEQPPLTLNPRLAIDANGQRITTLLFRGLTRTNTELKAQPDLAESWTSKKGGREWHFRLRTGLTDHSGKPITPSDMVTCLENYRSGKPFSPLSASFPSWKNTRFNGNEIIIELSSPDQYMPRNISALRYFTTNGQTCVDPSPEHPPVGSGLYKIKNWPLTPPNELTLEPTETGLNRLHLVFVKDENSRALKFLRGEADIVLNAFSLGKTRWIQESLKDRYAVIARNGTTVSYLAFNMNDPILKNRDVRRALALAIAKEEIVRERYHGFTEPAESLLSPLLPESLPKNPKLSLENNPSEAERLLDLAGFKRDRNGIRLRLRYKTTTAREGFENAMLFQGMLRKIGVELRLDVVEPAVFLSSIRKGAFQLYSSRWIGVADGGILLRTLKTGQLNNRVNYSNSEMNTLLDKAMNEPDQAKRAVFLRAVQLKMLDEVPYFPLWYWNNILIIKKELAQHVRPEQLSLNGALEPIGRIRLP